MTELHVEHSADGFEGECCRCGQQLHFDPGPRLVRADDHRPVCVRCGEQSSPALAALINLAGSAERVGRIGRHTVIPPYASLIELARAAENYKDAAE